MKQLFLVGPLALVFALGCAAPGRMADLRDSGMLSLGLGVGLAADAKLGFLTHPSVGTVTSSAMAGVDSRDVTGAFFQAGSSWPHSMFWASLEGGASADVLNSTGWRAAFESEEFSAAFAAIGEPTSRERPKGVAGAQLDASIEDQTWLPIPLDASFHNSTDFQLGATFFLVSARVGINLLETVDFLLGFAGIDVAKDDPRR